MRSSLLRLSVGALTPERTKAARLALEVYVGLIPTDADALIGLADLLVSDYLNRWNEAENDPAAGKHLLQEAEIRLNQAAAIDNSLPEIHYVRGFILRANHQHTRAVAEFEAAAAADPQYNFPHFHAQTANQYINVGDPARALPVVTQAIEHNGSDPSIGVFYWIKGRAYFFMPDYDNAIEWLERSVGVRPNLWYNRLYLVSAYALRNRTGEAQTALDNFKNDLEFAGFTPTTLASYEKDIPSTHRFVARGLNAFHDGLTKVGFWPP
jgi:adenylate cyclase